MKIIPRQIPLFCTSSNASSGQLTSDLWPLPQERSCYDCCPSLDKSFKAPGVGAIQLLLKLIVVTSFTRLPSPAVLSSCHFNVLCNKFPPCLIQLTNVVSPPSLCICLVFVSIFVLHVRLVTHCLIMTFFKKMKKTGSAGAVESLTLKGIVWFTVSPNRQTEWLLSREMTVYKTDTSVPLMNAVVHCFKVTKDPDHISVIISIDLFLSSLTVLAVIISTYATAKTAHSLKHWSKLDLTCYRWYQYFLALTHK